MKTHTLLGHAGHHHVAQDDQNTVTIGLIAVGVAVAAVVIFVVIARRNRVVRQEEPDLTAEE